MILEAKRVPFNGSVLGTAKDTWGLRVDAAMRVQGTDSLLLTVTLEKDVRSTQDATLTRRLGMLLPAPALQESHLGEELACDILS